MSLSKSVGDGDRYAITEKGRYDLVFLPVCQCNPKLIALMVQCPDCGTIYGQLSELDRRPDKIRGRQRWGR